MLASLRRTLGGAILALSPLLAGAVGGGCSVLSEDYPAANGSALASFRSGNFRSAARSFSDRTGALESDLFLSHAEEGMAWHVAGAHRRAVEAWLKAAEVLDDFRDRPTISGRSVVEGIASLAVNDKALPYDGEGFEVVLLHAFLAWEYLLRGDLDNAYPEVQLAILAQKEEEDRYEQSYGMNRFSRFVSALAFEADRQYDNARIDLEYLQQALPGNQSVQYSLERIERLTGGQAAEELQSSQLVVLFERGQMPAKLPAELPYGTRRSLGKISVPQYGAMREEADRVQVSVGGEEPWETESLENIQSVARRNLEDRLAWLAAKSIGRSALKAVVVDEVAEEVEEKHGQGAGLIVGAVGSLLHFLTERADLRAWMTLPASIQVLRIAVEPGRYPVRVDLIQGGRVLESLDLGEREFQPGKTVYLSARSLGPRLFVHASGDPGSPQP